MRIHDIFCFFVIGTECNLVSFANIERQFVALKLGVYFHRLYDVFHFIEFLLAKKKLICVISK